MNAIDAPVEAKFSAPHRIVEREAVPDIGKGRGIEVLVLPGHQRLEIERLGGEVVAVMNAGQIGDVRDHIAIIVEIMIGEGSVAE